MDKGKGYFLRSTSTDTIHEQWLAVKQTINGQTAQISDMVITLETLRDSLPAGTSSDYSANPRLLEAMDIKLKRDFKPHIPSHTCMDELGEVAETRVAFAHSTGLYDTRNQHTNTVSNAVTQARTKETRNNIQGDHQRFSNNTSEYNKVPPDVKERPMSRGGCYNCGKIGHFSSNCYQKPRT